jgi:hypothetical protein
LVTARVASPPLCRRGEEFNEGGFECVAQTAQNMWRDATPANLNRLLHSYGFRGE